ncbi:hypothetical protein J575_2370, partial [Acinetobacter baumannii 43926]
SLLFLDKTILQISLNLLLKGEQTFKNSDLGGFVY